MARVPRYPFRVFVVKRLGANLQHESYNEENLAGAWARRDTELRKERTKRVEICMVIDESTPDHSLDESQRYQRGTNSAPLR